MPDKPLNDMARLVKRVYTYKKFGIRKCESDPNRFWQAWNWVPCSAPSLISTPHPIFSQLTTKVTYKGEEEDELSCSANKESQENTGKFPCGINQTLTAMEIGDLIWVTSSITIAQALGKPHGNTLLSIPWDGCQRKASPEVHQEGTTLNLPLMG